MLFSFIVLLKLNILTRVFNSRITNENITFTKQIRKCVVNKHLEFHFKLLINRLKRCYYIKENFKCAVFIDSRYLIVLLSSFKFNQMMKEVMHN